MDGFEGLDGSAGSYGGAVEGGGGASEVELLVEGPALEETEDEAGVKDVSGSGGIEYGDAVGGGEVEVVAVPGEDAVSAEGGGGEAAAVAAMHLLNCGGEIGLEHEAAGEVAADDEVIDVFEEEVDAGIDLVEVGDDGDSGGAGPACGEGGGGGVVAVHVEGAGVFDPFALKVRGLEDEAFVATAEDSSLAGGVDEDEGVGAGSAGNGGDAGLDAGVAEGFAMKGGGYIVTEFADVAGGKTPVLTGYDGSGDLPAGEEAGGGVLDFGSADGVGGDGDYGVGGV